jgi:2-methylcitrate dehydratase PrpD
VQLHAQGVLADETEQIDLRVHPLVLELTGKQKPKNGLEGKFSVYHGCAVGLIHGSAGEGQFSDDCVCDPRVIALRNRVRATVDPDVAKDAVRVIALLKDGRRIEVNIDHAVGSLRNPLSDQRLESKFESLVAPVLGQEGSALISAQWKTLAKLPDIGAFVPLCCPRPMGERHAV